MLRAMHLDPDGFRKVMGHFTTGVTIVTTMEGARPWGITVNALAPVSLDPPLLMVALDRRRRIAPVVRAGGRFAVNILGEDQQDVSDCFAGAPVTPGREEFCGASWHPGVTGMPLLEGVIASIECEVAEVHAAGDHELFIGRVVGIETETRHPLPLLYYRRRYLRIERATSTEVEGLPEQ